MEQLNQDEEIKLLRDELVRLRRALAIEKAKKSKRAYMDRQDYVPTDDRDRE